MSYIAIAVVAYMLYAINGVVDKFLLTKAVKSPAVYAFYIGITSPMTWVLAPFGLKFVGPLDLLIAIIGGASFVVALYFLYVATRQTTISRLLPIEGGLVPIFTLVFAYLFLGERLSQTQLLAFGLMVLGAVLIAFKYEKGGWYAKALGNATIAAVFFALSFVLTKYIFDETNFVSGLIWTRLGFFLVSVSMLIPKTTRQKIFNAPKETSKGNIFLYYGARVSGGLAGLLQNYAISLGSVTLVNAMQGTQYAFLLVMAILLSRYYPRVLKEQISFAIFLQKIAAIILISGGLYFLAR
ncbi:MAG: hypothetical protein A3A83_01835 [Candidatus Doudnabacteria bacterium RIFCSPLOWO2_01_FULL_48_57]|nr:MAG: hypothetical protein A3F44_01805 [Candidatus Doudnabacteria bacterium RIFCSPHIGHO2_12_FULL_47_25]OGE97416.1 MAG: hypothetical protein A3A83_01835 [Candidatus Doudnabacteria bacterium RIFCSPLOWO2_01_FULL_48_57]OGF01234.1 MAG: hypothetical protein A3G07_03185 [Candidatus Doudnabacteria bacterium RIFCSPLOWO2_12_FULL_47_12]